MRITQLSTKLLEAPRDEDGNVKYKQVQEILKHFSEDELVELVNRALYQLEYQSIAHKKYVREHNNLEKQVRHVYKELYDRPFSKATPDELTHTMLELKKRLK